jgi:uncharacterized protein YdeI (YjbR/CyaY-like superfamily)
LLAALARNGKPITRAALDEAVARNPRQRFAFDASGMRIRASQGHSTAPRTTPIPEDLAAALGAAGATERFEALAFSRRKEFVRQVEEAKTPETRARRIEKILGQL